MSWKSRERHQATSFKAKSTHKSFARFKCHSLFQHHWSKCQICHITSFSLSCVVSLILGPLQLCCQVRCVNCSSSLLFVLLKASLQIRPINRMQCSKGRRLDPFKTLLLDMRKTQWLPFCLHSCCQLTCIYCPISQRLRSKFSSVLGHPVTLAKITKEKNGRMSLQNWVTIGPQFHYLSSLSTPHSKYIQLMKNKIISHLAVKLGLWLW